MFQLKHSYDFDGDSARRLNIYSNQFTNIFINTGEKKRAKIKPTTYDMEPLTMRQFRTITIKITMSWAKKKE